MSNSILGIRKQTEDGLTGAPVEFHAVAALDLRYTDGYFTVRISGYVNRQCYERGKKPVSIVQYQLHNAPPRGVDVQDWVLQELTGNAEISSPFLGCELVHADSKAAETE